jgi:hypothetical protein
VCVTELSHFGSVVVDPVMARVTTDAQLRVGYDPGIWPFTTVINDTPAGYDIRLDALCCTRPRGTGGVCTDQP